MDNFEKAVRLKLRFETNRGQLSVEELWDLNLTSLDSIAKSVNKQIQTEVEESFIPNKITSSKTTYNNLRLEILKYVILTRHNEKEAAKLRTEKIAKLQQLKDLAAAKANEQFAAQSLEDINKQIAELEADAQVPALV